MKSSDILWAIQPQFIYQTSRAYPQISFTNADAYKREISIKSFMYYKDFHIVPLRFSNTVEKTPYKDVMKAKYSMMGLDWESWTDYARPVRNKANEIRLMDMVGAVGDYHFVNHLYKSDNKITKFDLPKHNLPIVEMKIIPGFSLFDWMGVMEGAAQISTVSTSILYLLYLLPLKCTPNVYLRANGEPHSYYDYIFGDKFNYK